MSDLGRKPSEFEWGYLIACSNMMNLHDEPVIAADTLGELGVERSILKHMDLGDYDLEPLNQLFDELDRRGGKA